ncbi:uncharacterized protein LOC119876749 [Canis lupus familiaris]|uniref:uncharacterized protein LOC119876749 n=1 Tax=Canis lupus familiaris TaxID=9615 RepID=UPI0018F546D8|nr:uncharacterized protein LOC119876749 [Canis lupus familiaris]
MMGAGTPGGLSDSGAFTPDLTLEQLLRSVSCICVVYSSSCFYSNSFWRFSNSTSNFLALGGEPGRPPLESGDQGRGRGTGLPRRGRRRRWFRGPASRQARKEAFPGTPHRVRAGVALAVCLSLQQQRPQTGEESSRPLPALVDHRVTPLMSRPRLPLTCQPQLLRLCSFPGRLLALVSAGSPQSRPGGKFSKGSSLPSEGLTRPPQSGSLPPASHASSPRPRAHT